MNEKAILFDATRCTACRGCQVACKAWNDLKATTTANRGTYENPPDLSPDTWLTVKFREEAVNGTVRWFFTRRSCMHCTDAACVEVCPSNALYHSQYGFVSYDKDKCIGCGYCAEFCPFDVPRLDAQRVTGVAKMDKCTLCTTPGLDRLSIGQEPACVKACPPHALVYGDRDKLMEEGRRRVDSLKAARSIAYPEATLYGETELGGLHVLYVLTDSPEAYSIPKDPQYPVPATVLTDVFRPLRWALWGGTALVLLLNVLIARARLMRRKEEG